MGSSKFMNIYTLCHISISCVCHEATISQLLLQKYIILLLTAAVQSPLKPSQRGRGFPVIDGVKIGVKTSVTGVGAISWRKPDDPTVISFESIPACYRRTDGWTDTHAAYGWVALWHRWECVKSVNKTICDAMHSRHIRPRNLHLLVFI